ncbi:hypothetical protein VCHA50O413_90067 [Vibrio chagasii]|nr:hypothetical protein VCHA40P238_120068 [Vibrio chagasii]CAH7361681.1 hypothetical protein VCHA50O409_90068 [Vibrio chagasii]CAH7412512.1 hypothetical protein VCHA50O405_90101 [Vibrio chagasii]CAH7431926.1 hypothetical protein VCHA50O413_90067 [Vibrio chagasii]
MVSAVYIHGSYALEIPYHAIEKMRVTGYRMRRACLDSSKQDSRYEKQ